MKLALSAAAVAVAMLGACTPQTTPYSYSTGETMRAQPVVYGQVTGVRPVDIRPGETHLGTVAGALLGGIGGSQIGGGTAAHVAGGVAGAVAGGLLGSAIQGSQRTQGIEITVSLDSGSNVAIVQPGDPRDFRIGDRVRIVGDSENARVTR